MHAAERWRNTCGEPANDERRTQTGTLVAHTVFSRVSGRFKVCSRRRTQTRARRCTVDDVRRTVDGGRWIMYGVQCTVCSGRWTVDGGRWMADDTYIVDGGRYMVDGGQWTVDGGQWTVDGGRWTVDGGRWVAGRGASMKGGSRTTQLVKRTPDTSKNCATPPPRAQRPAPSQPTSPMAIITNDRTNERTNVNE